MKKLRTKWTNDIKVVTSTECHDDLEKMNIFRLWYEAKMARKLLRLFTDYFGVDKSTLNGTLK